MKINKFCEIFELNLINLDKIIGTTTLTKYYCQYRKDISLLRMINFTQTSTKQVLSLLKCQNIELKSTEKVTFSHI